MQEKKCTHCQKEEKQLIKADPQMTYLLELANKYSKDCEERDRNKGERNAEI